MKAGWETKKLSDVAELSGRIGWKGLTAKEYTPSGPHFLSVHGLNYGAYVDFRDAFHISQARYDESPEIMLRSHDILICKDGAGIGKVGIVGHLPGPTTINSSLLLIRSRSMVDPKYLFYCLMSPYFQKIVQSRLEGATTPHLYQRDISGFPVHVPPLDEQRRIVEVLDKAFAAIATAAANTRRNLANTRALFVSYLDQELSNVPEDAGHSGIGSETELCFGFAFKSNGYTKSTDSIPLLRGDNIVQGKLRWDDVARWPVGDAAAYRAFELEEGDVVLAMDRTWVKAGLKFAIIRNEDLPLLQVQRVARLRCLPSILNSYLAYQIESPAFEKYILGIQTGLGVPHISGKQIAAFRFKKPSLPQQARSVEALNKIRACSEVLIVGYESKLAALAELKQSLLHQAFAGELTPAVTNLARPIAAVSLPTPQFAANVIAFAQRRHQILGNEKTFGRVKAQKALHLVESVGDIDLGRRPMKDAAGPHDENHMRRAEDWAKAASFFQFVERTGGGYEFKKLANYDAIWSQANEATKPFAQALERSIDPIVPMNSEEAELLATTHAAWNNLILDGAAITDDAIIHAARDNWHASKLKFPIAKFQDAIKIIRARGIVPDGSAKRVDGQDMLI